MLKSARFKLIFCSLLCLCSSLTNAETYQVASGSFPPFTSESMPNGGLTTEIVDLAISSMGHELSVSYLPWRRGHIQTLSGEFFGTYPYSKNDERLKVWYFSKALYELEEVFFSQKSNPIDYSSTSDLQGKSVCKPVGYNLFGLKGLLEKGVISIEQPSNLKACFSMLSLGRVDLVMTNPKTAWDMIKALNLDSGDFRQLSQPFEKNTHHFIVPKTNAKGEAFIKQFDDALLRLKQNGTIQKILKKHL